LINQKLFTGIDKAAKLSGWHNQKKCYVKIEIRHLKSGINLSVQNARYPISITEVKNVLLTM